MADRQLVLIEWIDSHGATPSWEDLKDADGPVCCTCYSVGFLQGESDTAYRIVPHWAEETKDVVFQGCGAMVIPKIAVRSVTPLEASRAQSAAAKVLRAPANSKRAKLARGKTLAQRG